MPGLHELLRSLKLTLRIDHLRTPQALRLGLFGDRTDHRFIEIDMLELHVGDLDAPGVRLFIEDLLNIHVDLIPLSQHLIEIVLSND